MRKNKLQEIKNNNIFVDNQRTEWLPSALICNMQDNSNPARIQIIYQWQFNVLPGPQINVLHVNHDIHVIMFFVPMFNDIKQQQLVTKHILTQKR